VDVFGFGGSLRRGSFSWALLAAAVELAPAGVALDLFDRLELGNFPPFDQDLQESPPDVVREFKARIRAADVVLISTPEYNYSVPGYLKNAIDWASRPYSDNVFAGKPVAVMSASTGMLGAPGPSTTCGSASSFSTHIRSTSPSASFPTRPTRSTLAAG
jgi:chromate reductase